MSKEIETNTERFSEWTDGYFEGDPTTPLCHSTFGTLGFISNLHATYLRCIKPYVRKDTVALEIGPGRGAWTKGMLEAKQIWVLDALPESHNKLMRYLSNPQNVNYIQVHDFECKELPQDYFSYMFSFGCLCHVSIDGITDYANNLFPKLQSGADCFWMVADFEQFNNVTENYKQYSIIENLLPPLPRFADKHQQVKQILKEKLRPKLPDNDGITPTAGVWYNAGKDRTCRILSDAGYEIVDKDVGTVIRDPVIHFRKP